MKGLKGQYINLVNGSSPTADLAEVKFSLDSQVVKLGGRKWGWVWNRPRAVILEKGRERRRVPIIDFTRLLQVILYAVSLLLAAIGVARRFASKGGEVNGG
jgi:hypothetical protein